MSANLHTENERIEAALQYILANNRDLWLKILMALKSWYGEAGRDIAETWSQTDPNFNAQDFRDVWKGLKPGGGVKIGTLFHVAKQHGWRDDQPHVMPTAEQIAQRQREADKRTQKENIDLYRKREQAAKTAQTVYRSPFAPANNPYLVRKDVLPVPMLKELPASKLAKILNYAPHSDGQPLTGNILIVPIMFQGKLSSLEFIDESGRKSALSGGAKAGGYAPLQATPEGNGEGLTILIGEGVASCMTAKQATGYPAFAALSSGNLLSVAKQLRTDYPAAAFVILGELLKATGELDPHSIQAAEAIGARLAVPDFGIERHQEQTDINDYAQKFGVQAVQELIELSTTGIGKAKNANFSGLDQKQVGQVGQDQETPSKAFIDGLKPAPPTPQNDGGAEVGQVGQNPEVEKKAEKPGFRLIRFVKEKRNGVYFYGDDEEPIWICSPLEIAADTRDETGNSWGRLLTFTDRDNTEHRWAMPMHMLKAAGEELRGELLNQGLELANTTKARKLLMDYIIQTPAPLKARSVKRTGWHGHKFVLSDRTIGDSVGERVFYQSASFSVGLKQSGTLAEWRNKVAKPSIGNSRLVLSISTAFAALAMGLVDAEGGGIHLRGPSSSGKSTALNLAASVFSEPKYVKSWRSTDNALEGACTAHSDLCLLLDEVGQLDPKHAGAVAYMIANGQAKGRAERTGGQREAATWRLLFLSSGEIGLSDLVSESGGQNKAGHEVRCIDLLADASKGLGIFERVPEGMQPSEFSNALKHAAATHYGHAMPAYVENLAKNFDILSRKFRAAQNAFVAEVAGKSSGQVQRVAARFGLIAAAGAYATEIGLTGWPEDEAVNASKKCFEDWLAGRGTVGDKEPAAMLAHVKGFLEQHGDSRFTDWDRSERVTINRVGYRRNDEGKGFTYFVFGESFKKELARGFDCGQMTKLLAKIGALMPDSAGKGTRKERMPDGQNMRVYRITPAIWDCTL